MSCMNETKILSHCVRECAWDEDMTHCTGCLLTKEELKSWYRLSDKEKKCTLKAAESRLKGN
jgi:predicted Fe-S protein YdhL (DUF1289 family)